MQLGPAEWVAIVALGVALILGAPPIFQMMWGSPNISFGFTRLDSGPLTLLLIHLYNYPIANPLLSKIGVRREEAHFHVRLIIKDDSGNLVLQYTEPSIFSGNPFEQNLCHLHAGPSPKTIEILRADSNRAWINYEGRSTGFQEFQAGTYTLRLDVWAGEKLFFEERSFLVAKDLKSSYWVDR